MSDSQDGQGQAQAAPPRAPRGTKFVPKGAFTDPDDDDDDDDDSYELPVPTQTQPTNPRKSDASDDEGSNTKKSRETKPPPKKAGFKVGISDADEIYPPEKNRGGVSFDQKERQKSTFSAQARRGTQHPGLMKMNDSDSDEDKEDLRRASWTTASFTEVPNALVELEQQHYPSKTGPPVTTTTEPEGDKSNNPQGLPPIAPKGTSRSNAEMHALLMKHNARRSTLAKYFKTPTSDEAIQAGVPGWDWLTRLEQMLVHFFLMLFESSSDSSKMIFEMMPTEAATQVEEIFQLLLKADPDMFKELGDLVALAENWLILWREDSEKRQRMLEYIRIYMTRVKDRDYYKLPIQVRLHKLGAFIAGLNNMGKDTPELKYPVYTGATPPVNQTRLPSPRVKPATHFSRVVANILSGRPCNDPIPAEGVYTDKLGANIFKKTLHGDKEFKDYTDQKYGKMYCKSDIFSPFLKYDAMAVIGGGDSAVFGNDSFVKRQDCIENKHCWLPKYTKSYISTLEGDGCEILARRDYNKGIQMQAVRGSTRAQATLKAMRDERQAGKKIYEWVKGPDGKVYRRLVRSYTELGSTGSLDSMLDRSRSRSPHGAGKGKGRHGGPRGQGYGRGKGGREGMQERHYIERATSDTTLSRTGYGGRGGHHSKGVGPGGAHRGHSPGGHGRNNRGVGPDGRYSHGNRGVGPDGRSGHRGTDGKYGHGNRGAGQDGKYGRGVSPKGGKGRGVQAGYSGSKKQKHVALSAEASNRRLDGSGDSAQDEDIFRKDGKKGPEKDKSNKTLPGIRESRIGEKTRSSIFVRSFHKNAQTGTHGTTGTGTGPNGGNQPFKKKYSTRQSRAQGHGHGYSHGYGPRHGQKTKFSLADDNDIDDGDSDGLDFLRSFSNTKEGLKKIDPKMLTLNDCWEKAAKIFKKPNKSLVIPPAENLLLYLEKKFHKSRWARGSPSATRHYPNGSVFVAQYTNGASRVFYPHGGLAVDISAPSPVSSQILVVRDPTDNIFFFDKALLADLNSSGKGIIYAEDGVIQAQYSAIGGFKIEGVEKGHRWQWNKGGQRLAMKLNKFLSLRISDQDRIFLNFYGNSRGFLVNVATGHEVLLMNPEKKPIDPLTAQLRSLVRPKSKEDCYDYLHGMFKPKPSLGFVDKPKHWAHLLEPDSQYKVFDAEDYMNMKRRSTPCFNDDYQYNTQNREFVTNPPCPCPHCPECPCPCTCHFNEGGGGGGEEAPAMITC